MPLIRPEDAYRLGRLKSPKVGTRRHGALTILTSDRRAARTMARATLAVETGHDVRVGEGEFTYEWIEDWAQIPSTERARSGWSHTGMVTTRAGEIVTFHQGEPRLLSFKPSGELLRSVELDVENAHDIVLVEDDGIERLWVVDNLSGRVIKIDFDGRIVTGLERPDIAVYRDGGDYAPTSVAVDETRFGGSGDVWLTDGYGSSIVHRYTAAGDYVMSITGDEGTAGRFATPHGVSIDRRPTNPELLVADRSNGQVQVYDLDGAFKRVFGHDYLYRPCCFVALGEHLVIAEHRAGRLTVVDAANQLVCYLGENPGVEDLPNYPNVAVENLEIGKFNSPHGLTADGDGNIYVREWITGGRTIKLEKV